MTMLVSCWNINYLCYEDGQSDYKQSIFERAKMSRWICSWSKGPLYNKRECWNNSNGSWCHILVENFQFVYRKSLTFKIWDLISKLSFSIFLLNTNYRNQVDIFLSGWDFNISFPFRMGRKKLSKYPKFSWARKRVSHTALVNGSVTINFTVLWIRPWEHIGDFVSLIDCTNQPCYEETFLGQTAFWHLSVVFTFRRDYCLQRVILNDLNLR